jgi:uncharacterized protein YjbJ (UPF0337 family)
MSTATENTLHGKFNEVAGKVKQGVGEATGNDRLANEGTAQQVKGHAEQAWGTVKGAAEERTAEAKAHYEAERANAKVDHEEKAHDVREKIASTAANVKEHIQNAVNGDRVR